MFYQPINNFQHQNRTRLPSPPPRTQSRNQQYLPQNNSNNRLNYFQYQNCNGQYQNQMQKDIVYTDLNEMRWNNNNIGESVLPTKHQRSPVRIPSPHSPKWQQNNQSRQVSTATTVDNSHEKGEHRDLTDTDISKEAILRQLVTSCTQKTKEVVSKYERLEKIYTLNFTKLESELGLTRDELRKVKSENLTLKKEIGLKDSELASMKKTLNSKESQVSLYKTRMYKLLEINEKLNGCLESTFENLTLKQD